MVGKYPVITLCGSTRFKEQFLEARRSGRKSNMPAIMEKISYIWNQ